MAEGSLKPPVLYLVLSTGDETQIQSGVESKAERAREGTEPLSKVLIFSCKTVDKLLKHPQQIINLEGAHRKCPPEKAVGKALWVLEGDRGQYGTFMEK